ncbi:MAG: hypothetical protein V4501_12775 [Pseudomonadota bacterium]
MKSNDLHNNMRALRVISPVAIGANATKSGVVIDRLGYGGVEFIASYGAVTTTGTVCTVVVKEGDATGSMTSVADADLLGTEALASLLAATPRTSGTTKNVSKRIGYVGGKRYVTVDVVQTGVTSVGCVSVSAALFNPSVAPTSNP